MLKVPEWLDSLVSVVSNCIEPHNKMGPLGFRYGEDEDITELIIYPTRVELVGGANDGTIVIPDFSLNLQYVISAFEKIVGFYWCNHGFSPYDLDGPHVSIEGIYKGHEVFLKILADPPKKEGPGVKLDVSGKR